MSAVETLPATDPAISELIAGAGERVARRFLEFFIGNI